LKQTKSDLIDLTPFLPEHQALFQLYRAGCHSELAHSAAVPHLIWSDLLAYRWAILENAFCLFATSHGVTHLAHFPWGGETKHAVALAFEWMKQVNPSTVPGRIENVDESTGLLLRDAGYILSPAAPDYLYRRDTIVSLAGDRFHAQRAATHQAARRGPTFRPFATEDTDSCLTLFDRWAEGVATDPASLEAMMRQDARFAHRWAMRQAKESLIGRVVEVDGVIAGYTFGFALSETTFCVLLEIADRSIRGLAAWIFHQFCSEQSPYEWINTMDDSGLSRLARAKRHWHPVRLIPSYAVTARRGLF
jgi:hypothetical protein